MADSSRFRAFKIEPYLQHLLKENAPYIAIFVVLVALGFIAVPISLWKYNEHSTRASKLSAEVRNLEEKAKTLDTLLANTPADLTEDVRIVQALIPDSEDFFSIIYSLDELSAKTNFIIVSYEINLEESKEGVLALTISGIGDQDAFIDFLKKYNFEGGRLMTAKRIALDEQTDEGGISLEVAFYSKNVDAKDNTGVNYKQSLARLEELKNKISFVVREAPTASEEAGGESYKTKSNPF